MNNQISSIHTPCKQCVFAKYIDNTQTDCYLSYIDLYKQNSVEVLEAYDHDKEFFIINNKKCIGYRENKWFEKRGMSNSSIEDKIEAYRKSNHAHYAAIISLKTIDINQLNNICEMLDHSDIKPKKIILIRYPDNKEFPYQAIENIFKEKNISYPWRIQTMLDSDMPHEHILYDIIKNNKSCRFILSINTDTSKINEIINYANDLVYNGLGSFYACGDSTKNVVLYSSTVLRHSLETGKDILNDEELYKII
jgi:hypothetical protein